MAFRIQASSAAYSSDMFGQIYGVKGEMQERIIKYMVEVGGTFQRRVLGKQLFLASIRERVINVTVTRNKHFPKNPELSQRLPGSYIPGTRYPTAPRFISRVS